VKQNKVNLASFNNDWYKTGRSKWVRFVWICVSMIFVNSWFPVSRLKIFLLKVFGARIGKNVIIKQYVNVKYPWRLSVGDNVWIGERVWFDNLADIKISDNVCISQGSYLLTGNHNYKKSSFDLMIGEIQIEEGVWIGAKTLVGPGSTISSHSVLLAGTVFTGKTDAYSIYSGNPPRKIRDRVIQ
jgi:putative colanic acid biosynthesis acetyltransferase WcaF